MTLTVIVIDSLGLGSLPDAKDFGDEGAHTLDHIVQTTGINLANFAKLGLGNIKGVNALKAAHAPLASYGRMNEKSPGKDTTTGHWEFMGIVLEHAFKTYPGQHPSFPLTIMDAFDSLTGKAHLGNYAASGTVIIEELGEYHLKTGNPIVYTSSDSVFQIAAHIDIVPLEVLYDWCKAARNILQGDWAVTRVIARPFKGRPGKFTRLGEFRKDFSLSPPKETVLDKLKEAGLDVIGIGKIPDIYNHRGFSKEIHSVSNMDGIDKTLKTMKEHPHGLIFCNLVEFDSLYGHRRDPLGYARALKDLDDRLPEFLSLLRPDDVLMFISDHGNDPTWSGSDHTREYGLLLSYRQNTKANNLGTRSSFADIGASIANLFAIDWRGEGSSFF